MDEVGVGDAVAESMRKLMVEGEDAGSHPPWISSSSRGFSNLLTSSSPPDLVKSHTICKSQLNWGCVNIEANICKSFKK
ncbi:hypothetical protein L1987_33258 [Smallanthus sonchifolius]|uniref:Uncharacterized protein n=1 Tax=Smallanthus sonchifolius TaxID=185202 RepID=A0ACB9HQ98_9ASTR|nr:hypothetical protein L1987_33258 [Smallanthus sonchifolius]